LWISRSVPVDVLEHADGIGNDDVVERPFDRRQRCGILDVAEQETEIGMAGVRGGDRRGTEIDADAVGGLQRGEQVAVAATQFQHPLAGRDQEPHELVVVLVVCGIDLAPAVDLVDVGFVMLKQVPLALALEMKRSGAIGLS
jgi:hypothetical protein